MAKLMSDEEATRWRPMTEHVSPQGAPGSAETGTVAIMAVVIVTLAGGH